MWLIPLLLIVSLVVEMHGKYICHYPIDHHHHHHPHHHPIASSISLIARRSDKDDNFFLPIRALRLLLSKNLPFFAGLAYLDVAALPLELTWLSMHLVKSLGVTNLWI